MWERTLQDLIRGLRANKKDESKFIARAIDEIRTEIRTDDMDLKAGAVLKLAYLEMLGYDMSWASFHVVEVMSSPKFHLKSVGYLGAVQSFEKDTDVLMLTTNLLKKDLTSNPADVAVTLNGISHIMTAELARDLAPELIAMLNHSRANIRKKAVLAVYKVLLEYPEAFASAMPRLRDKLEDSDPGVVAATINVLCELARIRPEECLILAPQLFHLLTTSSNNWMLIKIVKLFGVLSPHESRLVRKLQPPITDLISTTPAISLLYECVHTCIIGGMLQGSNGSHLARMCVSKLASFIQDADQNLKYIALLALVKIVPSHPHLVAEYQDTIISSVNDQDISIRMRALDLVSAMVDQGNLQSIVQQILSHLVQDPSSSTLPSASQSLSNQTATLQGTATNTLMPPSQNPAYRLILSQRILEMCSQSTYENVTNFEWYLSVLVDLAQVSNVDIGVQIRDQLVDLVGRVRGLRSYAVKLMFSLLNDDSLLRNANEPGSCSEVLWAAAWICGEYSDELPDQRKIIPCLLQPDITTLAPDITAVYVHAATKVFGSWAASLAEQWEDDDLPPIKDMVTTIITRLSDLVNSPHIEVQERAANSLQLFNFIQADLNGFKPKPKFDSPFADVADSSAEPNFPKSLYLIKPLISSYELNPVASTAQQSVPIPEGLDLDTWIVPPPKEEVVDLEDGGEKKVKKSKKGKGKEANGSKGGKKKKGERGNDVEGLDDAPEATETPEEQAERERRKAERQERLRDDPYYIVDDRPAAPPIDDIDSIPIVRLEGIPSLTSAPPNGLQHSKLSSLRHVPESAPRNFVVDREGEMPEGATSPSPALSVNSTPIAQTPSRRSPQPLSSFPQYEGADDDSTRASTPEPIKVTRTKKKGAGKKKRTQNVD